MDAVKFKNKQLYFIDQTQLPQREVWRECKTLKEGYTAIKQLQVRGAPLIGVFAAYCIAVASKAFRRQREEFFGQFRAAVDYLKGSRPTAVNLFWALERVEKAVVKNKSKSLTQIKRAVLAEAQAIHKEDIGLCRKMADYGVALIRDGDRILTHCNAGALAAGGEGTAVAVIYKAHRVYKDIKVYADETRPLLQGARLTAWELVKEGVPCTLICDNMAAHLMQKRRIDKIFVGADRIAANGDTANKIGTYNLAVIAHYHKIPFYVVAPFCTFDLSLSSGDLIPIEERSGEEVKTVLGRLVIAPAQVDAYNPAFDVTPRRLITAIVTDRGIIYPPFDKNILKIIKNSK